MQKHFAGKYAKSKKIDGGNLFNLHAPSPKTASAQPGQEPKKISL